MDWDIVVITLIYIVVAKWVIGAGYGAYLLYERIPFIWSTTYIVGPIFWVGYGIGRVAKLITNRIRG